MSNTITFRLCDEDRERLDKIIEGLYHVGLMQMRTAEAPQPTEGEDEIQRKLKETLAKATQAPAQEPQKTASEAQKATDHPTYDPFPEMPVAAKSAPEASVKEVTAAELQQLAIALCRQQKQPALRAILSEYGLQTVSEVLTKVPEDKRYEVYEKMKALEG